MSPVHALEARCLQAGLAKIDPRLRDRAGDEWTLVGSLTACGTRRGTHT